MSRKGSTEACAIIGRDRALRVISVRKIIVNFENINSVCDVKKGLSIQRPVSNQPRACI